MLRAAGEEVDNSDGWVTARHRPASEPACQHVFELRTKTVARASVSACLTGLLRRARARLPAPFPMPPPLSYGSSYCIPYCSPPLRPSTLPPACPGALGRLVDPLGRLIPRRACQVTLFGAAPNRTPCRAPSAEDPAGAARET